MAEWRILLKGQEFDLQDVANLFQSPAITVKQETNVFYFCSSMFFDLRKDEYKKVRQYADNLISLINALAKLRKDGFQTVEIGGIEYRDDIGKSHQFTFAEGATVRVRTHAVLTVIRADGTVETSEEKLLADTEARIKIAEHDNYVLKALTLYGSLEPNWRNLFLVLEVIEDSLGGEKALLEKEWVPKGIKNFKHTANSHLAIGIEARHATDSRQPPSQPMSIEDARIMMKALLNKWIETRE